MTNTARLQHNSPVTAVLQKNEQNRTSCTWTFAVPALRSPPFPTISIVYCLVISVPLFAGFVKDFCYPPTENRPNIPRNSDRFHPRTFFRIILFPFHSEHQKPISRQFPLISEQKKTQSTFPYLGSWLVLLVRRWGVLAGRGSGRPRIIGLYRNPLLLTIPFTLD